MCEDGFEKYSTGHTTSLCSGRTPCFVCPIKQFAWETALQRTAVEQEASILGQTHYLFEMFAVTAETCFPNAERMERFRQPFISVILVDRQESAILLVHAIHPN